MDEKEEKKYFNEIKKIEKEYYSLASCFDLNFPKITNLDCEKKIFFHAIENEIIYNPQFEFSYKKFNEEKIKQLKNIKISTENDYFNIKYLYKQRIRTKIYEIKCHQSWGDTISTNYAIKYRGEPTLTLLNKAIDFCEKYKKKAIRYRSLTPVVVGEELLAEIERLTGQKAKINYVLCMASKMNISPAEQTININSSEHFTNLDLERLKVHEIGVHYMRYFNAKKINVKLFQKGTSNYIETEEGLAVYFEELKGVLSNAQMHIYAGRVIGTYYALKLSFYEVFHILKSYGFSNEIAFNITTRAKRNLSDTSKAGGFTKDYVYFNGYYRIKRYTKNHDIKDLFFGKIKLEDVYLLRDLIDRYKSNIVCDNTVCNNMVEEEEEITEGQVVEKQEKILNQEIEITTVSANNI